MVNIKHDDPLLLLIDSVTHSILASPRPPLACEWRSKGCTNHSRALS